jgi:carboxypeptidase Taq
MQTPDDLLALAGRSIHGRIRRALTAIPPDALQLIDARLRRAAGENGLVYERDESVEAIRVLARPICVLPEQYTYIHHATLEILQGLKLLPTMYLEDKRVRRVLQWSEAEDAFFREVWRPEHAEDNPVYGRLDAVLDPTSGHWRETLKFVEPNLSGVGGIQIAPVAERLVMGDVVPMLTGHDPTLRLSLPRDQRELFLQLLVDHQRVLGRGQGALCLLEPRYAQGGPVEQQSLCDHLRELYGVTMVHADPRDLRVKNGEVYFEDTLIDVVYRDYEVRDLLALPAQGHDIEPMRLLFRENRVVSSIGAELDQKAAFELLTDPAFEDHFTPEQRRLFARHVLWTRRVYERQVTLPSGRVTDLVPFLRAEREELVLKPNRGYGGAGIRLGPVSSEAEWDAAIEQALADADDPDRSWVVQRLAEIPVYEFPVVGETGHVHEEPFYVVMGFAPTEGGLGNLCRVSQKQVVNVAQRGGVVAVLVGEGSTHLHGPPRVRRGEDALAALRREIAGLRHLDAAIELLGWDEETMLPPRARAERGEQLATLESTRHLRLASPWLGDWLAEARTSAAQGSDEAIELGILARRREHALLVPDDLVRAHAAARSRSLAAWEEARAARSYALWQPAFAELLGLARERAQALARGGHPYDALLDEHDEGLDRARIGPVLTELRAALLPLVAEVASDAPPAAWLTGQPWADSGQEAFCRQAAAGIGFDFRAGRLDRSTHPFTLAAGEHDIRMTMRVDVEDPFGAIFGLLHETGHALYDQGLAAEHQQRLIGTAPGVAIHESQSRLWENQIGRSRAFWQWQLPALRALFPVELAAVELDEFVAEVNRVRRGLVRVKADEVTYNLHIVVRYELEAQLVGGELAPADLAAAWNDAMVPLAGRAPADDLEGVLQDIHWAIGAFGYFPSYTLGNLYAAQLFEAWQRACPDGMAAIAQGDTSPLRGWLREHVYAAGHRLREDEIVRRAAGSGLDAGAFVRYARARYGRAS